MGLIFHTCSGNALCMYDVCMCVYANMYVYTYSQKPFCAMRGFHKHVGVPCSVRWCAMFMWCAMFSMLVCHVQYEL